MHECLICNYSSNDKANLYHHNKSKKHILNFEKNKSEKEKEKELIKIKDDEIEKLKQKLAFCENQENEFKIKNHEIEKLKQKLIDSENQKKEFEMKAKIYKELSEKGKTINNNNNKIIINNNLSYVNKHFENAPPLQKISNFVLNGIDLNDDTQIDRLMDYIIYYHNNNCLHKLIGDHIIKNYKKDNLQQQSFHTTDVSRRKYLVKLDDNLGYLYDESSEEIDNYNPNNEDNKNNESESETDSENEEYEELKNNHENKKKPIEKNKSKWINDNEGIKLSYLLYEPFIRKLMRQIKKKIRIYNNDMKKQPNRIPTMNEIKKYEVLVFILKEIDTNKLNTNINTYIAPYFSLLK